jgi:hypothetical protein
MKRLLLSSVAFFVVTCAFTQGRLDNTSKLENHKVFGVLEVAIPEHAKRQEATMERSEKMGFANFSSPDKKIEVHLRKMDEVSLQLVKDMIDGTSATPPPYKGTVLRSEIVLINDLHVYVTDIKGQWNGENEIMGIFKYHFNAKGHSFNLHMSYPAEAIEATRELKEKMLQAIKILQ